MRLCREILYIRIYAKYNVNMVKIKSDKIVQFMKDNNFDTKKFCVVVGLSKRELNKILNNDFRFKFVSLMKLARFFDVNVDWLLDFGKTEDQTKFYL